VQIVRSLTGQVSRTHRRAITDTLTRLYNFGFFNERLELELERARATGDPVSVVLFDTDHYNDTHGHQAGNAVLIRVAEILGATGRRGDVIARYGGEEFVALLYGASREEARRFAEAVRVAIEAAALVGGQTQPLGRVTVSGGVATFRPTPPPATGWSSSPIGTCTRPSSRAGIESSSRRENVESLAKTPIDEVRLRSGAAAGKAAHRRSSASQ
jgi:diguanylate cyclase (GGDEF)-like protein